MKRRAAELGLLLASLAGTLLLVELGLRGLGDHPLDEAVTRVPDPLLRWRMNPALAEIDARGFRNPEALETAEVVAIGDSFTYGYNVDSPGTWPRQLERASGRSVYNLGIGGFGVLEYWHLIDEALALRPRQILVALYPVNDLLDVCNRVAEKPAWRDWGAARGLDFARCPVQPPPRPAEKETELGDWLAANTAVGSLWAVATAERRAWLGIAFGTIPKAFLVRERGFETVMHNRWLRSIRESTDLERPGIAEGFDAARGFFADGRRRAAAGEAGFGVLLIPSKAAVYAHRLAAEGSGRPEAFDVAVRSERALVDALTAALTEHDVPWVDALPWLERSLDEVGRIYPLRRDDHPFEPGYRALAEAAHQLLRRMEARGSREAAG